MKFYNYAINAHKKNKQRAQLSDLVIGSSVFNFM